MRFRASLRAMRRISWIDHRINDEAAMVLFLPWFGVAFFWLRRIGMMADHRHHGEGEHHQGHVAMPAMPGSALIVIEPELVLGGLKTVLDRPAMAFDRDQRFNGCSCWAPGGEEGEVIIGDATCSLRTAQERCRRASRRARSFRGALEKSEPGISRFPDAQLRI